MFVCRNGITMAKILLHGTLHVTVFEGRGMATPSEKKHHKIGRFFKSVSIAMTVRVLSFLANSRFTASA